MWSAVWLSGALAALVPGLAVRDTSTSHCTRLERYCFPLLFRHPQSFTSDEQDVSVDILWDSDISRAAGALLLVYLRDVLPYRNLRLIRQTYDYNYNPHNDRHFIVGVMMARSEHTLKWVEHLVEKDLLIVNKPHLIGDDVSVNRDLHVRLAPGAPTADCCVLTDWTSYTNTSTLQLCGFLDSSSQLSSELGEIAVYGAHESMALLNDLVQVAASAGVRLLPHILDRATLTRFIRTANHSFLFIDYSFWHWEPNVCKLFCFPLESESVCPKELLQDPVTPINFADVKLWKSNELTFIHMKVPFLITTLSLKTILEQEGKSMNIEESACAWVEGTSFQTSAIHDLMETSNQPLVFYCEDDPDISEYSKALNFVQYYLYSFYKQYYNFTLVIAVEEQLINCSDPNSLIKNIYELSQDINKLSVMGVIAAGEVGVASASSLVSSLVVPLLLVDTVPTVPLSHANGPAAMWRVSGRPRHLALALQRFVHDSGWTRLAVLSQPTPLAAELYAEIKDGATFTHREYQIPTRPTIREAEDFLHSLSTKVRVVFVNADTKSSAVIMAAAIKLKMSFAEGYVWIFREWPVPAANTTVLTVSFWARDVMSEPEWLQPLLLNLQTLWPNQVWPARALAFIDALLSLAIGRFGHPLSDPEIHRAVTIMNFYENLEQMSIQSFNHVLQYKEAAMEENYVFVDEWHGDKFTRLAAWRVNASQPSMCAAVRGPYKRPKHLPRDDGDRSRCLARAGDDFDPDCYDAVWTSTLLLLLALVAAALVMYRRVLRRRAARVLNEQESMRARHHHVAATLTAYLVKREAVELREKLGAGNFGNVHLAYLRLPPDNSRSVAAKELHANAAPAEESEFLREACTIASFNHEHVVRLVGVCISGGPPLVLMELALFGDLLGYLRARRHLAEGAECASTESPVSVEEAAHVSGEALTRLVREAAAALTYLGSRGVVHRDVRAANCLVNARRSLKLADFGMARETAAGADGAPEYACRRRAMFPVLWMAPESLAHGVFSAASDVWAIGVLVLEVVTLGARPYGSMSPLRVLEYVAAGGCPPLPLDASPHTRGLTRLCWQREAERRPSAAEIHEYLAERPQALRAAVFEPPEAVDGKFVQ
ncbi:unnamed protein product [Chrysodeixis includens]|uniref:Protein kinase domain-containing protein n=1 Tax=Chrysodeixis includens TaxID=689277 RepID=A0A9P0BR44_CHRIL|nr:unnamed protein product [Chrysodeixis includens]